MLSHIDYKTVAHAAMKALGGMYGVPVEMILTLALMSACNALAPAFTRRADLP